MASFRRRNLLFFVTFYDRIALSCLTESSGDLTESSGEKGELAPRSSQGRLSDCFWAIGKTNGPDPMCDDDASDPFVDRKRQVRSAVAVLTSALDEPHDNDRFASLCVLCVAGKASKGTTLSDCFWPTDMTNGPDPVCDDVFHSSSTESGRDVCAQSGCLRVARLVTVLSASVAAVAHAEREALPPKPHPLAPEGPKRQRLTMATTATTSTPSCTDRPVACTPREGNTSTTAPASLDTICTLRTPPPEVDVSCNVLPLPSDERRRKK